MTQSTTIRPRACARARACASILLGVCAGAALGATPAAAQEDLRIATGAVYRTFTLDETLAAKSATLLLVPVAADIAIGRAFTLELYGAFASGSIEHDSSTLELNGPVNANARAVWAAAPWARVSLGLSVPTGDAAHDTEEAQVAAILSTDLLGFREASFGSGSAITTGIAIAHQLGDWGIGYGGSYRYAAEFEPIADTALTYSPGSQLALRLAADRNVGTAGKLTLGVSYQHFAEDNFAQNAFRPGARIRADASYAFRAGTSSTWTVFVTDIWREQSDAALDQGSIEVDTTIAGSQNVLVLGTAGALGVAGVRLLPRADVRMLSREDGIASGWLGSVGLGVPFRLGPIDAMPRLAAMFGAIENAAGDRPGISGLEAELTLRWP